MATLFAIAADRQTQGTANPAVPFGLGLVRILRRDDKFLQFGRK